MGNDSARHWLGMLLAHSVTMAGLSSIWKTDS